MVWNLLERWHPSPVETVTFGAAAARRVAELGAQVAVTERRQSQERLLVDAIKRNNMSAAFIQADLSQPEQVKRI